VGIATLNPLMALGGLAGIGTGLGGVALGGYLMYTGIPMIVEGWNEGEITPCE